MANGTLEGTNLRRFKSVVLGHKNPLREESVVAAEAQASGSARRRSRGLLAAVPTMVAPPTVQRLKEVREENGVREPLISNVVTPSGRGLVQTAMRRTASVKASSFPGLLTPPSQIHLPGGGGGSAFEAPENGVHERTSPTDLMELTATIRGLLSVRDSGSSGGPTVVETPIPGAFSRKQWQAIADRLETGGAPRVSPERPASALRLDVSYTAISLSPHPPAQVTFEQCLETLNEVMREHPESVQGALLLKAMQADSQVALPLPEEGASSCSRLSSVVEVFDRPIGNTHVTSGEILTQIACILYAICYGVITEYEVKHDTTFGDNWAVFFGVLSGLVNWAQILFALDKPLDKVKEGVKDFNEKVKNLVATSFWVMLTALFAILPASPLASAAHDATADMVGGDGWVADGAQAFMWSLRSFLIFRTFLTIPFVLKDKFGDVKGIWNHAKDEPDSLVTQALIETGVMATAGWIAVRYTYAQKEKIVSEIFKTMLTGIAESDWPNLAASIGWIGTISLAPLNINFCLDGGNKIRMMWNEPSFLLLLAFALAFPTGFSAMALANVTDDSEKIVAYGAGMLSNFSSLTRINWVDAWMTRIYLREHFSQLGNGIEVERAKVQDGILAARDRTQAQSRAAADTFSITEAERKLECLTTLASVVTAVGQCYKEPREGTGRTVISYLKFMDHYVRDGLFATYEGVKGATSCVWYSVRRGLGCPAREEAYQAVH